MTVIDGHNLYFAIDRVDESRFEQELGRLVRELKSMILSGSHLLVLDGSGGRDRGGHEQLLSPNLRLVYSGSISADDWIVNWMMRTRPGKWTLVSGDRRLYERIRHKGLSLRDPKVWFREQKKKVKESQHRSTLTQGKLSFGTTEEWLDYFDKK